MLTSAEVKQWLSQAQQLALADLTSQRGILFLEQLLAAMVPKETAALGKLSEPVQSRDVDTLSVIQTRSGDDYDLCRKWTHHPAVITRHQPAGVYQSRSRAAYWDGRNSVGEPVASGVYFYTLTAGDFTATRKMLIRK